MYSVNALCFLHFKNFYILIYLLICINNIEINNFLTIILLNYFYCHYILSCSFGTALYIYCINFENNLISTQATLITLFFSNCHK